MTSVVFVFSRDSPSSASPSMYSGNHIFPCFMTRHRLRGTVVVSLIPQVYNNVRARVNYH